MWYVADGCCRRQIGDTVYTAFGGDVLLIRPLEYHCRIHNSADLNAVQYNLRFIVKAPPHSSSAAQKRAFGDMERYLSEARLIHDKNERFFTYFQQLSDEFRLKKPGFVGCVQSLCRCILTELIRLSETYSESIFSGEELEYHGYSRSRIDEFFLSKYLTDVKIRQLAEDMKITPRQVNRVMHKMFGLSFTQKLTEMRLRLAVQQLISTQKSVAQISRECGFNSYDYFFTCFRKEFDMSPGEYRSKFAKNVLSSEISEKQH